MLNDELIKKTLESTRTIAMVGVSSIKKEISTNIRRRPSTIVMKYMQEFGYRVIPVNPFSAGEKVHGETIVANLNDIKIYCKTDNLKDLDTVFLKKKVYLNEDRKKMLLRNSNYNYSVNLKTEETMEQDHPEVIELLDSWKKKNKYFRYKKRSSFNTPDGSYRIDITIVKSNRKNTVLNRFEYYKSFTDSKVLQEPETYELEIEYIKNNPEMYKTIYSMLDSNNPENFLKAYKLFVFYQDDDEMLKKINTNTLVSNGQNDVGSTKEMAINLSENIKNAKHTTNEHSGTRIHRFQKQIRQSVWFWLN